MGLGVGIGLGIESIEDILGGSRRSTCFHVYKDKGCLAIVKEFASGTKDSIFNDYFGSWTLFYSGFNGD